MSTEKEHLAAALAFLNEGAAPGVAGRAYSLGELEKLKKTGLPASYNEVHVTQRLSTGPRRTSLPSRLTQWRILTRAVGQSYANAQEMRRRAARLHEATLVVAGETYYVERAMSDDPIAPDDGWWSGVSEFTY